MMMAVDLIPLLSTVAGAVIAIGGTVIADIMRRRDGRHQYDFAERQRAYTEMVLSLGAGLEGLRGIASSNLTPEERVPAASAAVSKAGVYIAREKLLMTADPTVAQAGESAFEALIGIRQAVRSGAHYRDPEFHDAYHPFAEKMWRFRMSVREDLGAPKLRVGDINRADWDGRADCGVCNPPDQRVPELVGGDVTGYLTPATSMSRSSFLSVPISSRIRAASSNCSSRAAPSI